DFLAAPMDARKREILGNEFGFRTSDFGINTSSSAGKSEVRNAKSEIVSLNASQAEAVHRAVNCDVFHLIWGPPGTGKTKVIPEIVQRVPGPILLGAFTNTAVDKMLIALLDHDPAVLFLRVGRSSDSPELVRKLAGDA